MLVTSVWLIYSNHNLQDNHVYTFLRRNLCRTITLDYIKLRWVHLINRRVQLGCNLCVLETGYKHQFYSGISMIDLAVCFTSLVHSNKICFLFFLSLILRQQIHSRVLCHLSDVTESLCVSHFAWSCDSTLNTFHIIKTKQSFLSFVLFLNICCLDALFGRQHYVCIKGVTKHA